MPERDELYEALEACLAALEAGASLDSALAGYPALATELRPLLVAARAAGVGADLARLPAGSQVESRSQFLARASALGGDRRAAAAPVAGRGAWARLRAWLRARPLAGISPVLRAAITSLVILAGVGAGTYGAVAASAASLPGDPLYGVKRTVENTQLWLAPDDQARAQLQSEFDRRRVGEVQALAGQRRQAAVDFTGTLISISGPQNLDWLVSGVMVLVGPQVPIDGEPIPGAQVRVQGIVQADGEVQAEQVTVLTHQVTVPTETPTPTASISPEPTENSVVSPAPTANAVTASPSETENQPPTSVPVTRVTVSPTSENEIGPAASQTLEPTEGSSGGGQTQTAEPTQGSDLGGSQTQTPQPTGGGDHGGSLTQTPQPTGGGDHGGSQTQTPQPTGGGDHGGGQTQTVQPAESQTQTAQPTDGGDHGGSATPTDTPRPTSSSGGSPSNTPKPDG